MDQTSTTTVSATAIRYGGFWARLAARFLDCIIVGIGVIVINVILGLLVGNKSPIISVVNILVGFGYFCYMTKRFGATYGKKAVGVQVVTDDGRPLTWGTVILRETVGKIASGVILCIGYLMVAFTAKKQGLHDKIAGTVVTYKDPSHDSKTLVIVLDAIQIFLVVAGIVGVITLIYFVSNGTIKIDTAKSASSITW